MPNIGPTELIIVLVIALIVLGPKRLPHAARSLGQGVREFKQSVLGKADEIEPERQPLSFGPLVAASPEHAGEARSA